MESAAAIMSPRTGLNGLLLSAELNIPGGPEYENTKLDTKTAGVISKFSEKRTYQNSENVHNFLNT